MRSQPHKFVTMAKPLLFAAAMLLSGCTPEVARWSPAEAPQQNQVNFTTMAHPVRFVSNATEPTGSEAKALSDFLNGVDVGYGDQVTIDAGPATGNAAADALAAKRMDAVTSMLRKLRIRAQAAARPSVDGALTQNTVVVTVGRYVVIGPNCPDRSKPEGDDFSNTVQSNYGCATATNLGLMVANPRDLLSGTPAGPADADFAARGVQQYRAGEISKTIKSELNGAAN